MEGEIEAVSVAGSEKRTSDEELTTTVGGENTNSDQSMYRLANAFIYVK